MRLRILTSIRKHTGTIASEQKEYCLGANQHMPSAVKEARPSRDSTSKSGLSVRLNRQYPKTDN